MENRRYNIFFHLHTVSGISISLLLFIIFFCGAFALFRKELFTWETVTKQALTGTHKTTTLQQNVTRILHRPDIVSGARVSLYLDGESTQITLSGLKSGKSEMLYLDKNGQPRKKAYAYSGAILLHWLHFFWQFGITGYYIAGAVSLFFFLAIITGIWIHWEKIKTNFFLFRLWVKPKQMWIDLHTALGVIGLPFQFLYALTGSMFGLGVLVAMVSSAAFYEGNINAFYKDAFPYYSCSAGKEMNQLPDFHLIVQYADQLRPDADWERIEIAQLKTDSCYILFHGSIPSKQKIAGRSDLVFNVHGNLIHQINPENLNYLESVPEWMISWHYADFRLSGISKFVIKICWFVLAMASCAVIISGILIWEKARERKKLSVRKLHFNRAIVKLFLSVSYAFIPVCPAILVVQRIVGKEMNEFLLNAIFAILITIVAVLLWFQKNHERRFWLAFATNCVPLIAVPVISVPFVTQFTAEKGQYSAELLHAELFWSFLLVVSVAILGWRVAKIVKNPVNQL